MSFHLKNNFFLYISSYFFNMHDSPKCFRDLREKKFKITTLELQYF